MSFEGPLTLQCSVGQADLAVGGDVRPFVLGQKGVIANVCSSPGGSAASDLREDVLVTAVRMLEAPNAGRVPLPAGSTVFEAGDPLMYGSS